MLDGRRRPEGRFFIGMLSVLLVWWGGLAGTANAAMVRSLLRELAIPFFAPIACRLLAWF